MSYYRYNFTTKILTAFITFIVLFPFICKTISTNIDSANEKMNTFIIERVDLVSIALGSQLEGKVSFILGRGSIEENYYYVAYRVNDDNSKSIYKMNAEITKIYDTLEKGEAAYAEEVKNGYGTLKEIKLNVPVDTIQQEYNLSLDDL